MKPTGCFAGLCRAALVALLTVGLPIATCYAQAKPKAKAKPAAKSSDAAIQQYRSAVAFQNRMVYDLAVEEWQKFAKNYPDDPLAAKAQYYLGVCQFQLKDYAKAEAAFQASLAKDAKFELADVAYYNLGLAQFNQGQQNKKDKLKAAVASFKALLDKHPSSKQAPLALYYQAEALYSSGQSAASIPVYAQLLEKYPKTLRSKALYGLGVAQEENNQAAAAGKTYDNFLAEFAKDPLAAEVDMRRAETLMAQGKFADAQTRLARLAEVKGFEFADYVRLRRGACLYELKQYAEAADLYAALVNEFAKSSYSGTATIAAGKCYYLAGKLPEARDWLAKSQALGGETAIEATHWLARTLLKEGKPAEALKGVEAQLAAAAKSPLLPDLLMDQADALYEIPARRKDSIARYAAVAKDYPKNGNAPQAGYMAAYAALGTGQYKLALTQAKAFLDMFAKHALTADVVYVEAESNLQLRNYPAAAALYQRLIAEYPRRAEVEVWTVREALCLRSEKKYAETIELLTPKLPALKTAAAQAEAQFLIGASQFDLKKYAEAVKSLTASLAASTKWHGADETMLILARAQDKSGDVKSAIATAQKLIAAFPKSTVLDRAHFRLGEFLYADEKYSAAAGEYQQVLEGWPQSPLIPNALFGLGWSHLSPGQHKPAAAAFTTLIDKHPNHMLVNRTRFARARSRHALGECSGAIEDLTAFLKSDPQGTDRSEALYIRGLCEVGIKKYSEAVASFKATLEADPKYAEADNVVYEWAWALQNEGKAAEAVAKFAQLAKQYPESELAPEANYRVGESLYEKKEYVDAAKTYFAAYSKAGKTEVGEKAAYKLSWSYYQVKDYEKAQTTFAFQVKTFPNGPLAADAMAMQAESLFQLKKYEEALAAFEKSMTKKPSSETLQVIVLLHAGQAAAQLKKWDESLKYLTKCSTDFPESDQKFEVLYEQGWAQQNLGKLDDALKLYQQVADGTRAVIGARANFMAGEIKFLKKEYTEALRNFFRVAEGYGAPKAPKEYHVWQANATFEAARCLELLKKVEAARRMYKELIDRYPQSDKVADAKKKLASLGG